MPDVRAVGGAPFDADPDWDWHSAADDTPDERSTRSTGRRATAAGPWWPVTTTSTRLSAAMSRARGRGPVLAALDPAAHDRGDGPPQRPRRSAPRIDRRRHRRVGPGSGIREPGPSDRLRLPPARGTVRRRGGGGGRDDGGSSRAPRRRHHRTTSTTPSSTRNGAVASTMAKAHVITRRKVSQPALSAFDGAGALAEPPTARCGRPRSASPGRSWPSAPAAGPAAIRDRPPAW